MYTFKIQPPTINHQAITSMTNKHISSLSWDETEFNKAKITYERALKNSGYQATLKFEKPSQNTRRNGNRKVIWFNPPFSLNVKTNIGEKRSCNYRVKDNCPLDGKCLHECIVYQANVITNNQCKEYFGTAEGEFKLRYNNRTMSFRHKKREKDTELWRYLWKLKEENADYNLQWSIKA